jgi:hypothetical protein
MMKLKNNVLILLIILVTMSLGCQNDSVEVTNRKKKNISDIQRELSEMRMIEAKRNLEKSWSNEKLWGVVRDNKTNASFSVKINDNLNEIYFKIIGRFDKHELFIPLYAEIRSSPDGRFIQKINILNIVDKKDRDYIGYGEYDLSRADMVQMVDLNFDGYLDLRILWNVGATGCNSYGSFLYDQKSKRFVFNKKLSSMLVLKLDPKQKQIITYDRSGGCQEYMRYYKVRNNQFVVTKVEWTELNNANPQPCFKFTGIPLREGIVTDNEKFPYMDDKGELRKKLKIVKKEEFQGSIDGRERGMMGVPIN